MQAPHFGGRALRILLGVALIIYVAPVYFRIPARTTINSLMVMLGLVAIYSLIHIAARRMTSFSSSLASLLASGLLVAVFVGGFSALPIVGHGKGQLAAITFLGVSLLVAGVRASPGCELMAIPNLLFRKNADLPCLIFSPLDKLETKWRNKDCA